MDKVSSKPVAAVTGARQGIGKGIALALARSGFDLVLVDLVEDEAAQQTAAELLGAGARCHFVAADIAQVEQRAPRPRPYAQLSAG